MNPKLLMQQRDRKWLAERVCELEEFVELEISLKLEAVVKLTRLEADQRDNEETIDRLEVELGKLEADNAALQKQVEGYEKALQSATRMHATVVDALAKSAAEVARLRDRR